MKKPLKVIAGTPDRPLRIGGIEIPCYVLEGDIRVFTQRGLYLTITGRDTNPRAGEIQDFIGRNWLKSFISNDLEVRVKSPITFFRKTERMLGLPADILPAICSSITDARISGATTSRQEKIVTVARILEKASAVLGIIALVDEATGFQFIRNRDALYKLLDLYLKKEHAKWSKRFPDDFYIELFRLRGWEWLGMSVNRPSIVGKWTNQIVWKRLQPGLLEELERLNPKNRRGFRRRRYHQWLTDDVGHPALQSHLGGVVALMRVSKNWRDLTQKLKKAYPRMYDNLEMFEEEE